MKYIVENRIATQGMLDGIEPWGDISDNYVGDYVEAESPIKAIWIALEYLQEQARENGFEGEIDYDAETLTFDNEQYYAFKAKELEIK